MPLLKLWLESISAQIDNANQVLMLVSLLGIFIFIIKIPKKYSNNIGIEINHMVSPLPSGVMTAPKTTININAYLKFLSQNLLPIKPVNDKIYIINGNWNEIPNAIKN